MPIELDDWREDDPDQPESLLVAAIVPDASQEDGVRAFLWRGTGYQQLSTKTTSTPSTAYRTS